MKPIRIELPTEFQIGAVNAYLFTEPEPVLVDTGIKSEASWQALEAALGQQDLAVADLARVVITHPHVDHCGQAGTITAHSDADVWIWEGGADWLLDFRAHWHERLAYYRDEFLPRMGMSEQMQQVMLDYAADIPATMAPVPADRVRTFTLADTLALGGHAWQVLHMPGHASTQTCFYQPQTRQFLSADMLLRKAPTPIVERPSSGERVPALPQFLHSLDRVESLNIDTVYPGHGKPFSDHRAVIQQQRKRIEKRKDECLALIADGYHTLFALTNQMYGDRPVEARFAGLWMLVGYLDLLQAEGKVEEQATVHDLRFTVYGSRI